MNQLHVGFSKEIQPPEGGYLLIDDEVAVVPRARIFDPPTHCLNPLENIDYKKARELADALYTASPQGETTLTVRNGKRSLLQGLLSADRLDRIAFGKEEAEAQAMVGDLLTSPVLKKMLCNATNFSFNPHSVILARVNRKELGDFDALIIGLLLMAHYEGQVIVPDFGFYGRECHTRLIREERLIAGVNVLGELSPKLRQSVLLIKDKVARGTTVEDAEKLAEYERLAPGTNGFNDYVGAAIA
jgi:hypothetical protein